MNINDVNLSKKNEKVLAEMLQDINEDLTLVVRNMHNENNTIPIENIFRMAVQEVASRVEYQIKKRVPCRAVVA